MARLQAARARRRLGGRPQALDECPRVLAVSLYNDSRNAVKDRCATLGISRTTVYRHLDAGSEQR
jgi:DNA invertase Pin-like site-specific DNA recombinase